MIFMGKLKVWFEDNFSKVKKNQIFGALRE